MTMHVKQTGSRLFLVASALLLTGVLTAGCASHQREVETWGGTQPRASAPIPTYATPPVIVQAQANLAPMVFTGRTTFTQGCTGSFSVRDARTNREISNGRAFNSGSGLIALDSRGRQTRTVSSTSNLSVTFLPDCNCRAGGNQSSAMPANHQFAAQAPTSASCTAG